MKHENIQWREIMNQRFDAVIAERDEMKLRMSLWMTAVVFVDGVVTSVVNYFVF